MKEFDAVAFNKAFKDHLVKFNAEAGVKLKAQASDDSETKAAAIASIAITDFCVLWPKINKFLDLAITGFEFFFPTKAALLKAFVAAFKQFGLPVLCPPATP